MTAMTTEEPMIRAFARRYATHDMPYEDLAQELRIKFLSLVDRFGDDAGRVATTALWRHAVNAAHPRKSEAYTYANHDMEISENAAVAQPHADLDVQMDVAYALAALPPRHMEYVRRVFWEDQPIKEATREMGLGNSTFSRTIAPVLRRELAHLAPVA